MPHAYRRYNFIRDLIIIAFSIIIAFLFAKSGMFRAPAILQSPVLIPLLSFLAGIFFTSIFTTSPATVALVHMAQINSLLEVSFFGALGAVMGDFVIFQFIKNELVEDCISLLSKDKADKIESFFQKKIFKWLSPVLGAIIIGSPLPDELGLAMMGITRVPGKIFVPIVFTLQFLGILIICLIFKGSF